MTSVICGLESIPVHVEADVSEGMPQFEMVGYLSNEVKEARERVRTAIRNAGYHLPAKKITVNLTPANIRKTGNGCDLPVACAILAAFGYLDGSLLKHYMIIGEVGLDGSVLPVSGVLPAAMLSADLSLRGIIVPKENAPEAAVLKNIRVIPVSSLRELADRCDRQFPETCFYHGEGSFRRREKSDVDFSEINGQYLVRRACEIAVSGMHNLLMIGPPGSGKTMAAKRIPTILPPLREEEKLEIAKIYSICGILDEYDISGSSRPFRAPHHTVTAQAMSGGGTIPRPGEVSLAHHGVLFLDELPEFRKTALEVLREPLEEGKIHISRVSGSFIFPCSFLLIAAMNPCPCGYFPDMNRCTCTASAIHRYIHKISQPLLDRIDLCVQAQEVPYQELFTSKKAESSAEIRKRVCRVHEIQQQRFAQCDYKYNSRIPAGAVRDFCLMSASAEKVMQQKFAEIRMTARTYHKILRVARTLADMEQAAGDFSTLEKEEAQGDGKIHAAHIREAIFFHNAGKEFWKTI